MDKKKSRRKNNKKKIILISSIVLFSIIVLVCTSIFLIGTSLELKLKGSKTIKLEVGTKYKEKGTTAKMLNNDLSKKVTTKGKVNTKKVGEYKITYSVKCLFFEKSVTREVKVVDTDKPVIKLKGSEEVTINLGEEYKEEGYEVEDNYDKDLTDKVKVTSKVEKDKVGTYEILYEVEDSSHNKSSVIRKVNVVKKEEIKQTSINASSNASNGGTVGTYINGILLVNKKYHLPATYNPGENPTALAALSRLQSAAKQAGFSIPKLSGFRSYEYQRGLYNRYVARDGEVKANTYSAKPGQSEHQTGLAFDVGELDDNYGNTPAGQWLAANAHKYGFIIRFLKGKESITGYQYEPWHIRYVGESHAAAIYSKGITLEEYLGVA